MKEPERHLRIEVFLSTGKRGDKNVMCLPCQPTHRGYLSFADHPRDCTPEFIQQSRTTISIRRRKGA